jgi:hypothetical protein
MTHRRWLCRLVCFICVVYTALTVEGLSRCVVQLMRPRYGIEHTVEGFH